MYRLTLTKTERAMIDFVGGRYRHGTELSRLLCGECNSEPEADWDDDVEITFVIPEHTAWAMGEIIEEDSLALFPDTLKAKLYTLQGQIV